MRWLVSFLLLLAAPVQAFDLQGHRGARGLAPENTLAAFETALAVGVTTLELDLAMTKDGVLVVSHDRTLNPDHTRGPDG
jgi:glycerophosphoryl diester phosphodiesterase